MTEEEIKIEPYAYNFDHVPSWCAIVHESVSDALLAAAEKSGANIYQSISVMFNIQQFEEVEKAYQKLGKQKMSQRVFELAQKINQER